LCNVHFSRQIHDSANVLKSVHGPLKTNFLGPFSPKLFSLKDVEMGAALHFSCDAVAARLAKCTGTSLHPRHVLATTILASGLAFVDGSVVNVGLPVIGRSLEADAGALQWVLSTLICCR
jgi:hypothetical protein